MPVLVNRESGLAEDLSPELAQAAVKMNTHDIPMVDPEGNHVLAPHEEAASLLQQGYTQPDSEQLKGLLDVSKYSTTGQQLATGAEGAASSYSFGLSTAAERALGVPEEDINKRREINPVSHGVGEAVGFGAGLLSGTGEAALINKAGLMLGEKAAAHLGASAIGKIGSTAARLAAENALFTSGDEASKIFAGDPHQSIESSAINVGLSGIIGMGAGAALKGTGELWEMGPGKKLTELMQTVSNKAQGLPSELKLASGIDIAPEMEAALSSNPAARSAFQTLQESNSKAGTEAQEALGKFHTDVKEALSSTLGKTPEDIEALASASKAEQGRAFQDTLAKTIDDKIKPISEQYNKFQEKFASAKISPITKVQLQNDVSAMIAEQGLEKGPNEAGLKLAQKVIGQLEKQDTAQDLRTYIQGLAQMSPYGSETYQVGKALRKILSSGIDNTIESKLAGEAPALMEQYKATNARYSQFRDLLSELNDRLRLGREGKVGAESFIEALKSADPESVASRLSLKGDTNLQMLLEQQFPEAAAIARHQEINDIVKASLDKSGTAIDANKLFKNFNKLEPELRNYLVTPEGIKRIEALEHLVKQVPSRLNPSGTARTLDMLWDKIPASGAALVSMLSGHNPVSGYILGKIGTYIGKEIPDSARLAMLKFLGSEGRISAGGLRAAAQVADQTIKAEAKLSKAVLGVFDDAAALVIPFPKPEKIEKLRDMVDKVAADQKQLLPEDSKMGHYIPDHAVASGLISARGITYLAGLRPQTAPESPLDAERKPSKIDKAKYKQALVIAEQPLTILKSIKEGSLTPEDMIHLTNLYPSLTTRMQTKLIEAMADAKTDKTRMPYKTKMSMSLFMGQPLESSLKPANIMAAQPQMAAQQPLATPARSDKLSKLPNTYATPQQSREMSRIGKH